MKLTVRVKKLIDGTYQAQCIGTVAGDVSLIGNTREEAIDRMRQEIRCRIHWCPSSTPSGEPVDLEVEEAPSRPWRGSVL